MAYIAKLEWGKYTLDLNDGARYKIRPDFVPPATAVTAYYATGTNANSYGGSSKVGEKASNRQWSFTISCRGSTDAEISRAIGDLTNFLNRAGEEATPLYFAFRGNSDIAAEPIWGQYGTNIQYEITHASSPEITPTYNRGLAVKGWMDATFSVNIKPFGFGKRQRVATASGGVIEDTVGTVDGRALGLRIPEAATNLMTNPTFSNSTWNNGWTDGGGLSSYQEARRDYVLFGTSAARLTAGGATATNNFTQSINAGTANDITFTAYVRKPNGEEITEDDVSIYYGTKLATTHTSTQLGNSPWYAITTTDGGVGIAQDTGVHVPSRDTIILGGFMMEESSYATPLAQGELIGNAWTGTAHASTTTRTAAEVKVAPVAGSMTTGGIRVVWRADYASTSYSGDGIVFREASGNIELRWVNASTLWRLTDGTNNADTSVDTITAGEIFVFHAFWGVNGLVLYINGASAATNSTYANNADFGAINIGSTATPDTHLNGTFLDFAMYDSVPTAAEVLADYTNLVTLANDKQRIASIPWLWTKDGDDVIDNANDSTYDNYCVIHGIPGDVNADTMIYGNTSLSMDDLDDVVLSNATLDRFYDPSGLYYHDLSGQANANASGGAVERQSVNTTALDFDASITEAVGLYELLGKEFLVIARMIDNGSNLTMAAMFDFSAVEIATDFRPISADTNLKIFRAPVIHTPSKKSILFNFMGGATASNAAVRLVRTTAGAANVDVDYFAFLPRPYLIIKLAGTAASAGGYIHNNKRTVAVTDGGPRPGGIAVLYQPLETVGDSIEFTPNRFNILMSHFGLTNTSVTIAQTTTLRVDVMPRWRLLQ